MVGSCKEEEYVNDKSNTAYVDGDLCDPQLFRCGDKKKKLRERDDIPLKKNYFKRALLAQGGGG